jgi:SAM-dependent methyltransferase
MSFDEAEIQVLIALLELEQPKETPNNTHYRFFPRSLAEAAAYFRGCLVDWQAAYHSLLRRGLIEPGPAHYRLTAPAVEQANLLRDARPPIFYWYREFYPLAANSRVYASFCERLYGRSLAQAGFSDMEQVDALLREAHLTPDSRALDLGCGLGLAAEYLAERSGAHFTGLDYSAEAVNLALERTRGRRDRLEFLVGNLDQLNFAPGSFDLLVSIDSLYMPNDLNRTLLQMRGLLRPGGRMVIFYSNMLWEPAGSTGEKDSPGGSGQDPAANRSAQKPFALRPEGTPLGQALTALGLPFETRDFSAETYRLLQRKHRLGVEMRADFEAEGAQMLLDFILAESDPGSAPYDPILSLSARYLYLVRN